MAHHRFHRRGNAYHHGLEGRDALPEPFANALPVADPSPANDNKASPKPQTVVSVVYVTASKTFSGPVAGYTTIAVGSPLLANPPSPPPPSPSPSIQPSMQATDIIFNPQDQDESTTTTDSSSTTTTSVGTIMTTATANSTSTGPHTLTPGPTSVSPANASGSPLSQSSPSGGLSGAAKAGITLAVLVGVGLLLSVILLFYRRKKRLNDSYGKASDEGSSFQNNGGGIASNRRDSTRSGETVREVPQLSLRPVTQFLPNLSPNRKSAGSPLAMATAAQGRHATPSPTSSSNGRERKMMTPSPTNDPANPFGNHAEPSERSITPGPGAGSGVNASAFPAPSSGAVVGPAGFAAATAAGALAVRQKAPPPLDLSNRRKFSADASASQISLPLSDTGTDNSRSSATTVSTPVVATAGAAGATRQPSPPVHRVQLDFKPSMVDELGLRAGQLVRLLHEYDDGWALCIRLDRSQQGVCPRTCLSKQPVKPRPNSPRSVPSPAMRASPQGRPMAPQVQPPRSASPAGPPHSPGALAGQQDRPVNPYIEPLRSRSPSPPQPQSPALVRPQSPVISRPQTPVDQRPRANSFGQVSPPSGLTTGSGPSNLNPSGASNAERPPQRIPTVLRSGSPRPSTPQPGVPSRKPLPEHEVGHAI
ncbi:MAG: hypothetical protein M1813_008366 [Trichoglossum hirsutum]|nr:MAG: hypothetical protein M1813_008366 [Trichoglossum hirsutum]